jgi:Nuclease-related domain
MPSGLTGGRNLDADVIVVGPTGIWVWEVKHWSGEITCQHGQWRREKTYRGPRGSLIREYQVHRPFDKQWVKEADSVKETLRRRLPRSPNLHEAVDGGLVFTHAGLSLDADDSCEAWVYTPRSSVETLRCSSEIPDFTMHKRLHAIDALLQWSDQLHGQRGEAPSTRSSVELAERLHEEAVSHASSYLSSAGEPVIAATSEGEGEASKRVMRRSHPDEAPARNPAPDDEEPAPAKASQNPDDPQAQKDRRDYAALLLIYEEHLALEERLLARRERGEVPPDSRAKEEWAQEARRLEDKACKAMARMDEIEGRNPGLVSHELSARRAELAEKHDGLARRLG